MKISCQISNDSNTDLSNNNRDQNESEDDWDFDEDEPGSTQVADFKKRMPVGPIFLRTRNRS